MRKPRHNQHLLYLEAIRQEDILKGMEGNELRIERVKLILN
jgi:hypothetical protein